MTKTIIGKLLPYLRERSTWLGAVSLLSAVGIGMSPEDAEVFVTAGLALAGVIGIIFRDPATTNIVANQAVVETSVVDEQIVNADNVAIVEPPASEAYQKLLDANAAR